MIRKSIAVIALLSIIASCSKRSSGPEGVTGKRGGTYRINENGEMKSLDPVRINDVTSHHVAHQIYDLLLDFDANLDLKPEVATTYEVSPDGKIYTFHLRHGVKFYDDACFPGGKGRELNAFDVKYSYDRICDARTRTLGFPFFKDKVLGANEFFAATAKGHAPAGGVSGFRAPNDSTFVIELTQAFAPFINNVATGFAYIIPHEAMEKYGDDFSFHAVGSGAFRFIEWKPDQYVTMERNPNYWQRGDDNKALPYLDKIKFTFQKEDKAYFPEFKLGNLEECYRIPNEFFKEVVDDNKQLKGEYTKFQLQRVPAMSVQFYGFLTTNPLFKDKRVRQAFAYAVDRDRIIRFTLNNQAYAPAVHGMVPPSMPHYSIESVKGISYDPARAHQLLAEAGYPDGKGFPEITLQLNRGGGRNMQIAEAVQQMISENLGIKVKLQLVEFSELTTGIEEGNFPFYRLGWIADYPDASNFLDLVYGKMVPASGPSSINSSRYSNPEFDNIYEKALATQNLEERNKLYAEAEQIAMNDAPYLLTFYDEDYRMLQPWVKNYPINAMDRRDLKYVWFEK